jgi:ParB family chromosome partitioning protein
VTLAIVLAGIEASTSKNTWRYPDSTKSAYFTQLASWGYNLSEVEQIVVVAGVSTDAAVDGQEQVEDEPDADADDDELESN